MLSSRKITIRAYGSGDLDTLVNIFQRSIREVASGNYDAAQIEAWARVDRDRWAERHASRPTWIAMVDGEAAGFTGLEPDGHLDMMFVHPGFQRCGVATALLQQVERAARDAGTARIFTEASITARPFFERRGFRLIAAQCVPRHGQWLTNYRMEKHLSAVPEETGTARRWITRSF